MADLNLNNVAKEITLKEGKKVNLTIAQVKEVMKLTLNWFANLEMEDRAILLKKLTKKTEWMKKNLPPWGE